MMNKKKTWKITVKGMVQGIGYRPFVAEPPEKAGLRGRVVNAGGVVIIDATAPEPVLSAYAEYLRGSWPDGAAVLDVITEELPYREYSGFVIEESRKKSDFVPQIPPDIPVCSRCAGELRDPANRRYRYPFISCASCGPRYSIMDRLPYDRCNTAMDDFEMCGPCHDEYTEKGGIRRHAQTISCPDCGPQLHFEQGGRTFAGEEAFRQAAAFISRGGIAAVKDIGGYHLACVPGNDDTVRLLRQAKNRENKPFAMMFPNVESIRSCCRVSIAEQKLLESSARPIVLLRKQADGDESLLSAQVCAGSPYIGAMLPCNPLQIMLMEELGPLIMTSANLSGLPIITEDEEMRSWLEEREQPESFGIMWNERAIRIPLDDSIMRIAAGRTQVFRRARGLVPLPLRLDAAGERQIFAAGADMKAGFCFTAGGMAFMSQYLGDLAEEGSLALYDRNYHRIKGLFGFSPETFCVDKHPLYRSAARTSELAAGRQLLRFQHHKCHVASVIAEQRLRGVVIGAAFDGTGYGDDGTVWGGEFFVCSDKMQEKDYRRAGHLQTVRLTGGDEGARNCLAMYYGYLHAAGVAPLNEDMKLVSAALDSGINAVGSSSMGRLFDAASAALGICTYNDYEGQAAIELENAAARAARAWPLHLEISADGGELIGDGPALIRDVRAAAVSGAPVEEVALGFHIAISRFVAEMCRLTAQSLDVSPAVVLTGGTFQNGILLEETARLLEEDGFEVYTNEKVPSGDGGISLGQAYLCCLEEEVR
jgi:hydrogenase maturation protein HypF